MHRFYLPAPARTGATVEFSSMQSKQLARVLRMGSGELVETFDGAGTVSTVALQTVDAGLTTGIVTSLWQIDWPFPWRPVLYLALLRTQRFEWAVEKATEIGAHRIVPIVTARMAHSDGSVSRTRLVRWRQIAIEASEQCDSAFVAQIDQPLTFEQALQEDVQLRLLAWEVQDEELALRTPAEAMRLGFPSVARPQPEIGIFIGPEGGFDEHEIEAAVEAGCHLVTLGPRILRAETAAVAALALLSAAAHDYDAPLPAPGGA